MINIQETIKDWKNLLPKEILSKSVELFGEENLALACSFSAEDIMLLDIIQKKYPKIDIFTLDTGRLPSETYVVWSELLGKYPGLKIVPYLPNSEKLENFILENGPNAFYKDLAARKKCCEIRKIEGLKKAIAFKKAWITGLRGEQSQTREGLHVIEKDYFFENKFKINPLADLSFQEISSYNKKNKLPQNELYSKNYSSIGCAPCTRAVNPGEEERAGRWWWEEDEKKECGLHQDFFRKTKKSVENIPVPILLHASRISKLKKLENESIFILREAYKKLGHLGMLWSVGKDSGVILHLVRKAFFGHIPIKLIHIDTSYKMPEMIKFRDYYARKWNIELIVHQNKSALKEGMSYKKGRLVCCKALKTDPLNKIVKKEKFDAMIAGIRRDEEGSRSKERYFSPRDKSSKWDYKDQPPEFWDQFQTDFGPNVHVRVHPILNWTEVDIWEYIKKENIPFLDLYLSKNGKRYRSLGCAPCTEPIKSNAKTIDEIISELSQIKTSERASRAQDQADAHAMQKLRSEGYM